MRYSITALALAFSLSGQQANSETFGISDLIYDGGNSYISVRGCVAETSTSPRMVLLAFRLDSVPARSQGRYSIVPLTEGSTFHSVIRNPLRLHTIVSISADCEIDVEVEER